MMTQLVWNQLFLYIVKSKANVWNVKGHALASMVVVNHGCRRYGMALIVYWQQLYQNPPTSL